jgi:hypothetical protein
MRQPLDQAISIYAIEENDHHIGPTLASPLQALAGHEPLLGLHAAYKTAAAALFKIGMLTHLAQLQRCALGLKGRNPACC